MLVAKATGRDGRVHGDVDATGANPPLAARPESPLTVGNERNDGALSIDGDHDGTCLEGAQVIGLSSTGIVGTALDGGVFRNVRPRGGRVFRFRRDTVASVTLDELIAFVRAEPPRVEEHEVSIPDPELIEEMK